jgi:hypothetical protein
MSQINLKIEDVNNVIASIAPEYSAVRLRIENGEDELPVVYLTLNQPKENWSDEVGKKIIGRLQMLVVTSSKAFAMDTDVSVKKAVLDKRQLVLFVHYEKTKPLVRAVMSKN